MSEPVGNSPRGANIPGNSHKERASAPSAANKEAETPREPVEKIIEGKVVTRKQPWYRKVANSLIADDAQSIGDFLLVDVFIPALKNLISDSVKGGTDRILYGQTRVRRVGPGVGEPRSLRTRYDRMSEDRGEPRRMMSREAQARHDFDVVALDDRAEAIGVVEALIARVDRYGSASVADLYALVGVTGSYADQRHGWTNLDQADVRQTRDGWRLDLPRPEPLR